MLKARLWYVLTHSGIAADSPRLVDLVHASSSASTFAQRFLRLRTTPLSLDRIANGDLPLNDKMRLFTAVISRLKFAGTYKLTGKGRNELVDAAIDSRVTEFPSVRYLEVGASDGTSAIHLLDQIPHLERVDLTDRFPVFYKKRFPWGTLVLDADGRIEGVKILSFYLCLHLNRNVSSENFDVIETVNPYLRERYGISGISRFDVFSDRTEEPVHILKCANLLNLEYFDPEQIRCAVKNLGRSLLPGGYLAISQNNDYYSAAEAYFMLQHTGSALRVVEQRHDHRALVLFNNDLNLD